MGLKESFYEQGLNEYERGNLSATIELYKKCIEAAYKEIPPDHLFLFEKITELAHVLVESNQPHQALPYVVQAFEIVQAHTSTILDYESSADFLELLGNLSMYFEDYKKAVVCYSQAEFLYTDLNSKNLTRAKKSLAQSRQGEILTGIKELQSIVSIAELNPGTKNKARKFLADIMLMAGQCQEAILAYEDLFRELNQQEEISEYWLLETLFNLATANFETGNYATALNQYNQLVSEITTKDFPGSLRLKMQALMMIAKVSIILRDTREATRVLDGLDENTLLDSDLLYYRLIRAQVELHQLNSEGEGSYPYLDSISDYPVGEITNENEVEILTLQSNIHFHRGDFPSAIRILRRLCDFYQKTGNIKQLISYRLHLCQAMINSETGYEKREILSLLAETEELIRSNGGGVLPVIRQIQIAQIFCRMGEYGYSSKLLLQAWPNQWELIKSYALAGTKEQVYFQDILELFLHTTLHTSMHWREKSIELQENYLDLHIRLKSLYLLNSRIFREVISRQALLEKNTILSYLQKSKELNSSTFINNESYQKLKMEVDILENKIKLNSDYFEALRTILNIRWKDIREELGSNEVAIAFSRYVHLEETKQDRSGYIAILIFRSISHPEFIDLDIGDEFLKEVLPFKRVREFDPEGSFRLDVEVPLLGDLSVLYDRIFRPLESALKGIRKIYFTAEGLLNYIPFGALLDKENSYLADRFELIQLQNLRDIKVQATGSSIDNIAIFGGIDFGRFYEGKEDGKSGLGDALSALGQIPAAGHENEKISDLFSERGYAKYLSGHLDLETFKDVCREKMPSCLHILTHGFFFNDEKRKYSFEDIYQYKTTDISSHSNPLLRSGIFASDYNYFLNKTEVRPNETGVITSWDISRAPLENTTLVTIHACESALGAVRNGETYGLARAFRMAGANYVILTLWQIQYTGFYIHFYRHMLERGGKDVRGAFNAAISNTRQEYPNPYWWSGFVLVE